MELNEKIFRHQMVFFPHIVFSAVKSKYVHSKILLLAEFKPQTSNIRRDHSAH